MMNAEHAPRLRRAAHAAAYSLLALSLVWVFATRAAAHADEPLTGSLPEETVAMLEGGPLVALVFQAQDCVNDLDLLEAWSERVGQDTARVVGLLVNAASAPQEAVAQLTSAPEVRFPVHRVERAGLQGMLRGIGYRQTPVVVLLDRHGRVRAAAPLRSPSGSPDVVLAAAALLPREQ